MYKKFTPGNWRFYTKPQPNGCPIVGSNGLMVCMLAHSVNYPDQEEEAISNAKLISSAPELFDALIEVIKISDRDHDAYNNAKKLIKRITDIDYEEIIKT